MSVYQNNRFLKRVNPEIVRAKDDSGSSLNHPEIQKLMRQMVDLDIADNLKLWVHNGLVKTRTSGSDLYVPKSYDISGEENDAAQATTANQPKLVSTGMEFDGSDDYLDCGKDISLSLVAVQTYSFWFKTNIPPPTSPSENYLMGTFNDGGTYTAAIQMSPIIYEAWSNSIWSPYIFIRDDLNMGLAGGIINGNYNDNNWHNVFFIVTKSHMGGNGTIVSYVDGVLKTTDYVHQYVVGTTSSWIYNLTIGARNVRGTISSYYTGLSNDIRIFNKALSSTEISAIYNLTKSYYGIT